MALWFGVSVVVARSRENSCRLLVISPLQRVLPTGNSRTIAMDRGQVDMAFASMINKRDLIESV
jgi:hypothetical protein